MVKIRRLVLMMNLSCSSQRPDEVEPCNVICRKELEGASRTITAIINSRVLFCNVSEATVSDELNVS